MSPRVAILGGNRVPFGRAYKAYRNVGNQDLLTAALDGLAARFGLAGERLDEVAGGAVIKSSRDFNLTRESVIGSALDPATPAVDVQRACATSLEAATLVGNKIALGQIDVGVAAGADSVSGAPLEASPGMRRAAHRLGAARSAGDRARAIAGLRPRDLLPAAPGGGEPRTGLSMGEHQALSNERWGITREEQDAIALRSHERLARAWDEGFFSDLATSFQGLSRDENLRETSMEKLARLKPAFGGENGTMTAGNSTPMTDGAASVLLASDEWAEKRGLRVLAHVVDVQTAAVDFVRGADLLSAPIFALPRLLERNDVSLADIDLVEIHEAFAGTVAMTTKAWASDEFCRERLGLDGALGPIEEERLNVHGSSIAAGHPFAATGARILPTLAKALYQRGPGALGLISVCAAGGQGAVALLRSAA